MKNNFTILFALLCFMASAQTTADFENFQMEQDTFLNGSDGSGGFTSGNISLINNYDDTWGSWTGWSISNTTDNMTPGFMNQYSSVTGGGHDGSSTYATAYVVGESLLHTINEGRGVVEGFYLTNTTYSYLSMLEGDAFAKRFGGEDGKDPDYLYVTIKEHGTRNVKNDSINIFLADYRFEDDGQDYILDDWIYVDLNQFGNIDTLSFTMHSSDVGMFGINTPTYFCIDNVTTADLGLLSTEDGLTQKPTLLYPNPAHRLITIPEGYTSYVLVNNKGQSVKNGYLSMTNSNEINIQDLKSGVYSCLLKDTEDQRIIKRFIKI